MRNLELPGRSPAHGLQGMAATSHTLSTLTAVNILQKGGNALDAAMAACAVQCVVEPESTGLGGDCFCLYSPAGADEPIAFNGSGRAPAAATVEWYLDKGITSIERQTPHAATVPAAVDAWCQLNRDHGKLDLGELLQPAIQYARDGYPVSSRVSVDFAAQADALAKDPNLKRVFMPNGRTPGVGEMHRQPELAATLQAVADNGREAFYTGAIADDMVSYLQSLGGLHTMEDFANSVGDYVTPISTEYRGHTVWECPPNGQGVIALLLLNIMAGYDAAGVDPTSVERLHLEIEAGRLAYQDRNVFVADPNKADVPTDWLLSDAHAAELRAHIDPDSGMDTLPPVALPNHEDTVYISVVDKDRNACSFINTLFNNFGAALMAPKSGITFTNRAQGFVVEPSHRNCIAPNKRPLHTIIPGMVSKGGRAVMPFGVMGGQYQSFGHMHFLSRFFDFGMDIQEAQDAPRIFPIAGTRQVEIESGVPAATVESLKKLGHQPVKPGKPIGGSQAIWIDWERGILTGGSEPRKDGCAIGY
ncbi:MAG: gamma-glutamyltransferase, partial [Rhodospirillaceae bacterium]